MGALHTDGSPGFTPFCARRRPTARLAAASPAAAARAVASLRSVAAHWTDDDGVPRPRVVAVAVNPASGRGRGVAIARRWLAPALEAAGVASRTTVTTGPADVIDVAATADPTFIGALVVVGGDGTASLLLEGLMARPDARSAALRLPLALLPAGSGNALAVAMGVGVCPRLAAAVIARGRAAPLDVLAVDGGSAAPCGAAAASPDPLPRPRRTAAFLSLTYGLVANADVGTESWRWIWPARFIVGALREVLARRAHPVEVWCVPADSGGGDHTPPTRPEAATPRVVVPPVAATPLPPPPAAAAVATASPCPPPAGRAARLHLCHPAPPPPGRGASTPPPAPCAAGALGPPPHRHRVSVRCLQPARPGRHHQDGSSCRPFLRRPARGVGEGGGSLWGPR